MSEKWTQTLAELLALQRKMLRKLNEALGITRELAEAVEREDQVSVRLLLSSRQMPLLELQELDAAMDLKRCELNGADEAAFDRLVTRRGAAERGGGADFRRKGAPTKSAAVARGIAGNTAAPEK